VQGNILSDIESLKSNPAAPKKVKKTVKYEDQIMQQDVSGDQSNLSTRRKKKGLKKKKKRTD